MQLSSRIVLEAFNQPWLLTNEGIASGLMLLNNALKADSSEVLRATYALNDYSKVSGTTAVIPLSGILSKHDYCGSPGTATIASWINQLNSNSAVENILLVIDSPGGSVMGTYDLMLAIKKSKKPVYSYVDGLAGSAAAFIASCTSRIFLANEMAFVGSLGVMTSLSRVVKGQKINGIATEVVAVYSKLSEKKNSASREFQESGTTAIAEKELTEIDKFLKDSITESRDIKDTALTGDVFRGSAAIAVGLADEIAPLDAVLAKISTSTTTAMITGKDKSARASLAEKLGLEAGATNEQIDAEVTALLGHKATVSVLIKSFGEAATEEGFNLTEAVSDLVTEREAFDATLAERDATIAQLKKDPADRQVTATDKDDKVTSENPKAAFLCEEDVKAAEIYNQLNAK